MASSGTAFNLDYLILLKKHRVVGLEMRSGYDYRTLRALDLLFLEWQNRHFYFQ